MQLFSLAAILLTGSTLLANAQPIEDPRAEHIVNAFRHAWSGYRQYAWGHDELRPLTNGTSDSRYVFFWSYLLRYIIFPNNNYIIPLINYCCYDVII